MFVGFVLITLILVALIILGIVSLARRNRKGGDLAEDPLEDQFRLEDDEK